MSVSYSQGQKGQESRFAAPTGITRKARRALGKGLLDIANQGGLSALANPTGIIGSQYANLFGDNPANDYLGARAALQNTLSGEGLGRAIGTAYGQLAPSALESIRTGGAALRNAAGPLGLRFSTDLSGQQGALAGNILNQLNTNALTAGMGIFGQQADTGFNILNLIGGLGSQNNPLALLAGFGGEPQLGTKGGGGGGGGSAAY